MSAVPTPEQPIDYLDEDAPLRNQNYACVSFLSPEDVLANKEVFYISKFLEDATKQLEFLLTNLKTIHPDAADRLSAIRETNAHLFEAGELQEQYRFFKSVHSADIEDEFHRANEFRTTVRGFKVRGVFDTIKEAEIRAQVLKRMGDKHNIFVAQVGCWVPWDPRADQVAEQKYTGAEQLNTLMSEYNKNMNMRDQHYEERKQDKVTNAMEERDAWLKRREEETASAAAAALDTAAKATLDASAKAVDASATLQDELDGHHDNPHYKSEFAAPAALQEELTNEPVPETVIETVQAPVPETVLAETVQEPTSTP